MSFLDLTWYSVLGSMLLSTLSNLILKCQSDSYYQPKIVWRIRKCGQMKKFELLTVIFII